MESTTTAKPIIACATHDPGCRDIFNCQKTNIEKQRGEKMHNLKVVSNDKGLVVSEFPEYPATDHLFEISCNYKIES